ncbi:MAG: MarR family transcriptional regulator [Chloroflexota bacterium]|nr:MarR family transcriptional regulator [Chloroflexota bacterium]
MTQESQKEELVEKTLQLSDKAFQELIPILPKEWLKLDLTMPQLKVVLLLFQEGPLRMSVIASELGVSLATATGIIDRLVERDIVFREDDPDDRRVVLCHLSDKGENLISGLWHLSRERTRDLLEAMDLQQLLLLGEVLEALLQAGEMTRGGG